jgi:hypothetical protein
LFPFAGRGGEAANAARLDSESNNVVMIKVVNDFVKSTHSPPTRFGPGRSDFRLRGRPRRAY